MDKSPFPWKNPEEKIFMSLVWINKLNTNQFIRWLGVDRVLQLNTNLFIRWLLVLIAHFDQLNTNQFPLLSQTVISIDCANLSLSAFIKRELVKFFSI